MLSAPAARSAGGAAAAAGALSGFFVADHAADHQSDESAKNGDKNDIDEICAKPCQHVITSLEKGGQDAGNRGLRPPMSCPVERREIQIT